MTTRPRIAILARLASNTSATRYAAIITARRLAELVWAAGGDPITLLPTLDSNWEERLEGIHGVLMPGGADINPQFYGQQITSDHVYDVDNLADQADIDLLTYTLNSTNLPYLGICRGLQITNVARGGTLIQHMEHPHQHNVAPVKITTEATISVTNRRSIKAMRKITKNHGILIYEKYKNREAYLYDLSGTNIKTIKANNHIVKKLIKEIDKSFLPKIDITLKVC